MIYPWRSYKLKLTYLGQLFTCVVGLIAYFDRPTMMLAQSQANSAELRSAIERLDSSSATDWAKSETALQTLMKDNVQRQQALKTSALFRIRRGDSSAISSFCKQSQKHFPEPSPNEELLLLRISIWDDLANERQDALLHKTDRLRQALHSEEVSMTTKHAIMGMLGNIIGLVHAQPSQKLLSADQILSIDTACLEHSKKELVTTYTMRKEESTEHTVELATWINTHESTGIEQSLVNAESEIKMIHQEIEEQKLSGDAEAKTRKDCLATLHKQEISSRELTDRLKLWQVSWNKHPHLHILTEPIVGNIKVPLYKRVRDGEEAVKNTKTRTIIGTDGKPKEEKYTVTEYKPKYKQVRKPQSEIDAEVDLIYTEQLNLFRRLEEQRNELLAQHKQIQTAIDSIDALMKESDSTIESLKEKGKERNLALKRLSFRLSVISEGVQALKSGKPQSAFRPPIFNIVDYAAEERVLKSND